jgi:hypothetical protein
MLNPLPPKRGGGLGINPPELNRPWIITTVYEKFDRSVGFVGSLGKNSVKRSSGEHSAQTQSQVDPLKRACKGRVSKQIWQVIDQG